MAGPQGGVYEVSCLLGQARVYIHVETYLLSEPNFCHFYTKH